MPPIDEQKKRNRKKCQAQNLYHIGEPYHDISLEDVIRIFVPEEGSPGFDIMLRRVCW